MQIIDRFIYNIEKYKLIDEKDTIIVATSGGPDSQFLTYLLYEIKEKYKINIVLAHLNHLHRKESYLDEQLVEKTAKELGLKVFVRHESMDDYAKEMKISPEDAGRRLRYSFLREISEGYENFKIATGHNKDDQAETVLMRMIRGSGLDGLCAMDYKNGDIIRPILSFSKKEIIEFLNQNNIPYALDKTNFHNDYTRNYIRNEIIRELETINPNVSDSLFTLSQTLKDDKILIDHVIDEEFTKLVVEKRKDSISLDRNKFNQIPDYMAGRIMRRAILELTGSLKDISKENIDEFLSIRELATGKKVIKYDIIFIKNYHSYKLSLRENKIEKSPEKLISLNEEIIFNNYLIRAREVDKIGKKNQNTFYFDMDELSFPLKVRTRQNGDKFKPLGMDNNKKLKDFFIDQKIDRDKRDVIPLILSNDEIICVLSQRISEDYKVTNNTRKILKIEVANVKWYKSNDGKSSNRWRNNQFKD